MVVVSAADARMSDAELHAIGDTRALAAGVRGFNDDKIIPVARECAAILQEREGLDAIMGLVKEALSPSLRETAYALALDVALAEAPVLPEENRILQRLRAALEVDRLTAAALEKAAIVRHARITDLRWAWRAKALLRLSIFVGVFVRSGGGGGRCGRGGRLPGARGGGAPISVSCAFNTAVMRLSFLDRPGAHRARGRLMARGKGGACCRRSVCRGLPRLRLRFVVLDLAIYAQHVAFHFVPAFWRLHRVHHADTEFDVTTGVRFHPVEILLSQAWKIAVVLALGAPALAVLVFEIALNATSMFSHSNLQLGRAVDRSAARW